MQCEQDRASSFNVEVSGWDINENFFVENTLAEWKDSGKSVRLRRAIRQGCLLFVRLLDANGNRDSYPVAYRARGVSAGERYDLSYVELAPVPPRDRRVVMADVWEAKL